MSYCGSAAAVFDDGRMRPVTYREDPFATIRERASAFVQSDSPKWEMEVVNRIKHLTELPVNWNSYGATRIDSRLANAAYELLMEISDDRTPAPAVIPTNDGKVQLEWHRAGIDLEVRALTNRLFSFSVEDEHGEIAPVEERHLWYDFTELREALNRLAMRVQMAAGY